MSNEVMTPPELDPRKSASAIHELPTQGQGHVSTDHLGIGGGFEDEGIIASLWENLRDTLFPKKLPPLVLTSKPVPVPDRMAVKRSPASVATSTIIHALIFLLIGFLVAKKILKLSAPPAKVQTVDLGNPPIAPMAAKQMGGGGGNHDITPATKGKLPPPQKIPVPLMHPIIEQPKLPEPPSLELQKNLKLPSMNMPNIGDPNGLKVAGPGSYGNGGGGGIGGGSGNGLGPGSGGGTGGGVYQVGGGVSAPVPISTPEAEFSDEARKAKYQGAVEVTFIVDVNGRVQNPHVVRDPGMGLGEKALEAVRQWTFHPAKLQGKPVPVRVQGEVTFTIY